MQTQCPHCETSFRVTETQVQVADGLVRCGICGEVFNAVEIANHNKHQQTVLSDTAPEIQPVVESPLSTGAREEALNDDPHKAVDYAIPSIEAETTDSTTTDNVAANVPSKDVFDLFDEENNESLQHVVPDKYRDTYSTGPQNITSTVLWSIAVLFLSATLALEYIWFNRNQFSHIPELQSVTHQLCQQINCQAISMRDPEKIELVSRNVYSHPNNKDALMINVTMANKADFSQPYPVMQINFSDVRGGTVAARRFLPNEYLSTDTNEINTSPGNLFSPESNTSLTLEIIDPGKQAMTYEFSFL